MSVVLPVVVDETAVKPIRRVCYDNNLVNSQGLFLGEEPLTFSLPLLILEISLIFVVSNAIHFVLKHLGQARVVSQILTGLLLGRTVMGYNNRFQQVVFPERSMIILDTLSHVSFIFFLFTIGIKTDLTVLKRPSRRALTIGVAGSLFPLALALGLARAIRPAMPPDLRNSDLISSVVQRFSFSAFPVLADTLEELGLINSDLGRVATTAALITDSCSLVVTVAIDTSVLVREVKEPRNGGEVFASLFCFVAAVFFMGRPLAIWVAKRTPPGELLSEGYFVGMVLAALVSAMTTEIIGYRWTLGPLLLGLVLPGGMPLGVTMMERLESYFSLLFLPIYVVMAGYWTDLPHADSPEEWSFLGLLLIVCFLGKLVGAMAAAVYCRMSLRDAVSLGLMVNIKGTVEIAFVTMWGGGKLANLKQYTVLMMAVLFSTAVSTPLLKLLYNPSVRYVARKRCTIQHAKPGAELRILACVHNEDHVPACLNLLEASGADRHGPVALTVLHLTGLVGRAAAVLRPYKRTTHRRSAYATATHNSASDRIVNAFLFFEKQWGGAFSVQPFVAMSPYATMHNDVCSLALERRACLILLPFHRQSDGALETTRQAFRSFNRGVLAFAPCSVAILVDRGLPTNRVFRRVIIYYLGGPDDREALAFATVMANNELLINLTVVRFVLKGDALPANEDARLDDKMVEAFRVRHRESGQVVYVEKAVHCSEGTVAAVTSMSEKFELVIVGRRKGEESALTSGLSVWSECPELGVIGDMLASTDFGEKVAILVLQQQRRVAGERGIGGGGGGSDIVGDVLAPRRSGKEGVTDVMFHGELSSTGFRREDAPRCDSRV